MRPSGAVKLLHFFFASSVFVCILHCILYIFYIVCKFYVFWDALVPAGFAGARTFGLECRPKFLCPPPLPKNSKKKVHPRRSFEAACEHPMHMSALFHELMPRFYDDSRIFG